MGEDGAPIRRQAWKEGPNEADPPSWLSLSDDELLFRVEGLPDVHDKDPQLLEVVRSDRHFFVRQEAAKKLHDKEHLKAHSGDRHLGQILVRGMTRSEDAAYLERILQESRHVEVKKAAEVQLRMIRAREAKKA